MDLLVTAFVQYWIFWAVPTLMVLLLSAVLRQSPKAGLVALLWTMGATAIAIVAGELIYPESPTGVRYLIGGALVVAIAARDGYRWGASLLWLLIGPPGWWILLWVRNNQLDRRDREPVSATAGASPVSS